MAYALGYFSMPFILSFIIVKFAIAQNYEKKHNKKYPTGNFVGLVILIGIGLSIFTLMNG